MNTTIEPPYEGVPDDLLTLTHARGLSREDLDKFWTGYPDDYAERLIELADGDRDVAMMRDVSAILGHAERGKRSGEFATDTPILNDVTALLWPEREWYGDGYEERVTTARNLMDQGWYPPGWPIQPIARAEFRISPPGSARARWPLVATALSIYAFVAVVAFAAG